MITEQALGRQDVIERHEQTATQQDGDERHKDIRQDFDRTAEPIAGFGSYVFQAVGGYGHVLGNEAGHFLEDDIDVAGADDDLEHAAGLEGALEVGVIIQRGGVYLVRILQHHAQARGAVRECDDVVFAAQRLKRTGSYFLVVHRRALQCNGSHPNAGRDCLFSLQPGFGPKSTHSGGVLATSPVPGTPTRAAPTPAREPGQTRRRTRRCDRHRHRPQRRSHQQSSASRHPGSRWDRRR